MSIPSTFLKISIRFAFGLFLVIIEQKISKLRFTESVQWRIQGRSLNNCSMIFRNDGYCPTLKISIDKYVISLDGTECRLKKWQNFSAFVLNFFLSKYTYSTDNQLWLRKLDITDCKNNNTKRMWHKEIATDQSNSSHLVKVDYIRFSYETL